MAAKTTKMAEARVKRMMYQELRSWLERKNDKQAPLGSISFVNKQGLFVVFPL